MTARVVAVGLVVGGLATAAVAVGRPVVPLGTGGGSDPAAALLAPAAPAVSPGDDLPDPRPPDPVSTSATPTVPGRQVPASPEDAVPRGEGARTAGSGDAALPAPELAVGASTPKGDRPVEVVIPAIGVRSRLVDLGIAGDGTMQVPSDFARAGWLTAAPAPGQRGPAVIAGHVDSREGPAVFFRLHELVAGDEVRVVQADGDVVSFTVRGKESFAKDAFPTDRVYGPVPGPVLRLVTCSGEVDPVSGHYLDNTVVFAS